MKLSVRKGHQELLKSDFSSEVLKAGKEGVTFLIGRSPDCHICLNDRLISREHASLKFQDGFWTVSLLSSFGKLTVNGEPTLQKKIQVGDTIEIPPFTINVEFVQPVVEVLKPSIIVQPAPVVPIEPLAEDLDFPEEITPLKSELEVIVEEEIASENKPEDLMFSSETPTSDGDVDHFGGAVGELSQGEIKLSDAPIVELSDDAGDKTSLLTGFAKFELEILGEYAPYDRFVLTLGETFIGRDPTKCQIILTDPESSSVHAVVRKVGSHFELEDLKSSNGTLFHGSRVNKSDLTSGDEFIIGSTTFTFMAQSSFVEQEKDRLMPVEENQVVEVEEIVEAPVTHDLSSNLGAGNFGDSQSMTPKSASLFSKDALRDPQKRKKLMIGAVILLALWVLLEDEEPTKKATNAKDAKKSNLLVEEKKKEEAIKDKNKRPLKKEDLELVSASYELAKSYLDQNMFFEATQELDKIHHLTDSFKESRTLEVTAKRLLAELEELERKRQQEIEKQIKLKRVKELVEKAKEATKERKVTLAEALFNQILELDPENYDVAQFKVELDAWKKEDERIAVEKAQKEANRKRKIEELQPGKKAYLSRNWNDAINKLQAFLEKKDMDEDLVTEATQMLTDAQTKLNEIVLPLLGKARSLKEGQDLKGSYENYQEILRHDPGHQEAMVEMDEIKDRLFVRARKIYREALISESLSLFNEAKEKFQEIQQVAPKDSEYYRKASDRLKDYLE